VTTSLITTVGETVPSATDDPVRLLLNAARDGLIEYPGHTMGDRYEIRIAGESRQVPSGDVAGTVARLRAVRRLDAAGVPVELEQVYADTGSFRLQVGGVVHVVQSDMVVDWVSGYLAGFRRGTDAHVGDETFEAIWRVLDHPDIADQARLVILGLMYGDPDNETSMDDLAVLVQRTKKTVIEALSFGNHLADDLKERMISAFGRRWRLRADGTADTCSASGDPLPAPMEMPGIERLRWIGAAVRRQWLRYVGQPSPNKARWLREYELAVGSTTYSVSADSLEGWLAGLEAWYEQTSIRESQRPDREGARH
jgi:hypothetical protein